MNKAYCLDDEIGFVELINKHEDPGLATVNAARCSYGEESTEFTDKDRKLTGYLWNHGHTSPFRHAFYTFHLVSPLFLFRQILKYQVGSTWKTFEVGGEEVSLEIFDLFFDTDSGTSWNELSGRYKELEPKFYFPRKLRANVTHGSTQASMDLDWDEDKHSGYLATIREKCDSDYRFYKNMLKDGVAKEIARMTLPQNVYSEAYWTISLHAILNFLSQRLKKDSQLEIRKCAEAVYSLVESDLDKLGISKESIVE